MPVGPLAITDELSIDLSKHAGESQAKEFPDEYKQGRSVPVINKLFDLGRLGRKVGKGFMTTKKVASASGPVWRGSTR